MDRLAAMWAWITSSRQRAAFGAFAGAALLIGGVGIGLATVGADRAGVSGRQSPVPSGAASPTATATPTGTVRPSSAAPTPSTARTDVSLEVDGLARITVEELLLKAVPGTGGIVIGKLPRDAVAFVVAGPTEEDGYTWYQLAAAEPFGEECGALPWYDDTLACQEWFGWAAAGSPDGTQWLAGVDAECSARVDLATFLDLGALRSLSCVGSAPMTLRAFSRPGTTLGECAIGYSVEPVWLGHCASAQLYEAEDPSIPSRAVSIYLAPELGACDVTAQGVDCPFASLDGRWVDLVVHLDDPRAQACVGRQQQGFGAMPDPAAIVLRCRASLVATEVSASDDLGTLDQEQTEFVPQSGLGYQPQGGLTWFRPAVAQTFTAARSGELGGIQLQVARVAGTSGPLVVELRRGGPDGALLATSTAIDADGVPIDSAQCLLPVCLALDRTYEWVTIPFEERVTLTAGQQYALVLPPEPTAPDDRAFFIAAAVGDVYAGGWLTTLASSPTRAWIQDPYEGDLAFRTYVVEAE